MIGREWLRKKAIELAVRQRHSVFNEFLGKNIRAPDSCECVAAWPERKEQLVVHQISANGACSGYFTDRLDRGEQKEIPWVTMLGANLEFFELARGVEYKYKTSLGFLTAWWTGWWRVRRARDFVGQSWFNLTTPERTMQIEVLRVLVDHRLADDAKDDLGHPLRDPIGLRNYDVAELLHGHRIYEHPRSQRMMAEIGLALDALASNGELREDDRKYFVTGKALTTIAAYEEDNRRHKVAVWQNWLMVWLTFVIACAAIAEIVVAFWS